MDKYLKSFFHFLEKVIIPEILEILLEALLK